MYLTDTLAGKFKASNMQDLSNKKVDIRDIVDLKNWSRDLKLNCVNWKCVIRIVYGGFTKNFKLL